MYFLLKRALFSRFMRAWVDIIIRGSYSIDKQQQNTPVNTFDLELFCFRSGSEYELEEHLSYN